MTALAGLRLNGIEVCCVAGKRQEAIVPMSVEAVGRGNQHYGQGQWEPAKQAFGEALSTEKGDKGEQHYLRALCAQQLRHAHDQLQRRRLGLLAHSPDTPRAGGRSAPTVC